MQGGRRCFELRKLDYGAARERKKGQTNDKKNRSRESGGKRARARESVSTSRTERKEQGERSGAKGTSFALAEEGGGYAEGFAWI